MHKTHWHRPLLPPIKQLTNPPLTSDFFLDPLDIAKSDASLEEQLPSWVSGGCKDGWGNGFFSGGGGGCTFFSGNGGGGSLSGTKHAGKKIRWMGWSSQYPFPPFNWKNGWGGKKSIVERRRRRKKEINLKKSITNIMP